MTIRHWKAVLVVSFLLASWYFTFTVFGHQGDVRILNSATELVEDGEIEVCNQKFTFGSISPGKSQVIHYQVRTDSHYKIVANFKSGRKLAKEVGYVTNGRDFKDVLTLKDDDVSLTEE